ncbi:uncharacterized protein LOC105703467 [Orussus abietinus]|uniref:uncharacterized protein LOC105703467 n=1 Tax=Orussus abietinus TaxID=222816 RepID=UPI000C715B1C|nr:uncharacterized protein LOC105703467 [Orussus abietinus]
MKKRRPSVWSHLRIPKYVSRPRSFASALIRSKSLHDPKRKRLLRDNASLQTRRSDYLYNYEETDIKDVFASLESLFDVKKPINFSEVRPPFLSKYGEGYTSTSSADSKSPRSPLIPIEAVNHSQKDEPHHLQPRDANEGGGGEDAKIRNLKEELEEIVEELTFEAMADEEVEEEMVEGEGDVMNDAFLISDTETGDADEEEKTEGSAEKSDKLKAGKGDDAKKDGAEEMPPSCPMPEGVGEGVPVGPERHRESNMSALPLTDSAVMKEMKEADERCAVIAKEIEDLKKELTDLTNKEDLTQEDTQEIKRKQEDVMKKLAEIDNITRKLQRLLGLADPSSRAFAKMFEMLPRPGEQLKMGDESQRSQEIREINSDKGERKKIDGDATCGKTGLEFPQMEYPEDKLPRVIVCGHTEENIPKIVVADSDRKGKRKCLQSLTGKLSESLTMQERLAKENAELEGGKYRLEEALLEKDNAVESLQRKVHGLQAEMRIVIKENSDLSKQLVYLTQKVGSPSCCDSCPGGTSSHTPSSPSTKPGHFQDDSFPCKCHQDPHKEANDFSNTVCVSPRLAGGSCGGLSESGGTMCCRSPATTKPSSAPSARGACPAELENKLAIYGSNTKQLEQQLGSMECEVRNMQMELANVQRERQQLEQQRKLLKCTGPCAPCACCPPPMSGTMSTQQQNVPCGPIGVPQGSSPPLAMPAVLSKWKPLQGPPPCSGSCTNAPMGPSTCPQQQLRDLREQYARLQDDYKSKLCEVSCLRADAEKMKQETKTSREEKERMENKLIDVQERLKILEAEKNKLDGSKELMVEQEQALLVAKQRFREAQDELEELRSLIQDQANQLEDYRNKYLQAQQQVEEQRRQLDLMEMDNARMNENVTLEIGRVKNQFQEKLAELAPLPDLLKQTQMKLQESQQLRLLAERNCEDLSRELLSCKDKMQALQNQLEVLRNENQALQNEKGSANGRWDDLEKRNNELRNENERLKNALSRFEEHESQLQKKIDEKMHEVVQLTAMLEQVREDSARQVARTKERCETVRRTMQGQIAEMERQLAQCRATARAAQKDRDEIRQKMQGQINNLNEAFEQAQGRIRSLQGHVNYLKNSYSNIFHGQGQGETPGGVAGEPSGQGQGQGYDSCDCNY